MTTYPCAHCGQICGDYAGGYASVSYGDGPQHHLCHPNDPARPDCYRRVTVHHEGLGALRDADPKPRGVIGAGSTPAQLLDNIVRAVTRGMWP